MMPYTIEYIVHETGLVVSWTGKVTGNDVRQSYRERFSPRDRFKTLQYILVDYTQAQEVDMSPDDIYYIAKLSNDVSASNKNLLAVAVMPTDMQYGLARMWQFYADDDATGWRTMVTRTREEAETWLRETLNKDLTFRNA